MVPPLEVVVKKFEDPARVILLEVAERFEDVGVLGDRVSEITGGAPRMSQYSWFTMSPSTVHVSRSSMVASRDGARSRTTEI